ncbi:MAG TPA: hypothetical protein DCF45_01860, partial [Gammaproteobacteria bacterium]|nr:hypothetical protein [Gammaproteobacteria bacterium]
MNSEHNPDQENGSTDSLDNLLDSVRNHLGATPESAADLDEEIPLLTDVVVPATGTQPPPHNITPGSALIEPELSAPAEDPAGNEGNLSTTSTVVDEEVTDLLNETVISEVSAMQTTPAIGDDDAADPPVHLSQGDPYGETQSEDHEKAADDWLDETVLSTPIEIAGAPASDTPQNDNEQSFDINLEMAAETTRLESIDDETADPMVHLTSGSQGDPYGETQSKDHEKAADDWLDETVLSTTNEIAGPPASEPTQSPDNEQGFDIDLELAAETTRLDSLESPAVNILAPEDSRQQTVVPEPDNKAFSQIVDQDSSTGDSQTPSSQ